MSTLCGPSLGQGTGDVAAEELCAGSRGPAKHDLYLYQGDDWREEVRWVDENGAAVADLTAAAILLQVRTDFADNEPEVLFSASVGDGVDIVDGPNALFEVYLSAAKTVLLTGSEPFWYDLQVTPSGGDKTTILRGKVFFDLEIARETP